eukprot:3492501-Amphidinium_carterae.1
MLRVRASSPDAVSAPATLLASRASLIRSSQNSSIKLLDRVYSPHQHRPVESPSGWSHQAPISVPQSWLNLHSLANAVFTRKIGQIPTGYCIHSCSCSLGRNRQTMQLQQGAGLMHETVDLSITQRSAETIETSTSNTMGKLTLRTYDTQVRYMI